MNNESIIPCQIINDIDSWDKAKRLFSSELFRGCSFRGQGSADWPLTTSLERATKGVNLEYHEQDTMLQFQRKAHAFLQRDNVARAEIDWLALMQHHGAPTRLLDVTRSAYVAAFFALEKAETTSAVWALHTPTLAADSVKQAGFLGQFRNMIFDPDYLSTLYKGKYPGIFLVEPFYLSDRMRAQQAHFLFPGDPSRGFEDNLLSAGPNQSRVARIELPLTIRLDALRDLERMGITRETLFPGLDGLAHSLHWSIESHNASSTILGKRLPSWRDR